MNEGNKELKTTNHYTREGDKYIFFGSYPQSLKKSSVTVSAEPDKFGNYYGDDGCTYKKVFFAAGEKKKLFKTEIKKGETYYFKIEPVRWRILEEKNGVATLLCDSILDCKPLLEDFNKAVGEEVVKEYLNSSGKSQLTANAKKIVDTYLSNLKDLAKSIENGLLNKDERGTLNDPSLGVFLLSDDGELRKYFWLDQNTPSSAQLIRSATDYAIACGASLNGPIWDLQNVAHSVAKRSVYRGYSVTDYYYRSNFDFYCISAKGNYVTRSLNVPRHYINLVPAIKIKLKAD